MSDQPFFTGSSNFSQITISPYNLTYSDKHKYGQKASKTKQSLSKNNQSSKEMRLQSSGEYIFFAFRKFYGKITFHDLPFIFTYNLISPKIIKAAYNRKNNKNITAILDHKQLKSIKESCTRG